MATPNCAPEDVRERVVFLRKHRTIQGGVPVRMIIDTHITVIGRKNGVILRYFKNDDPSKNYQKAISSLNRCAKD